MHAWHKSVDQDLAEHCAKTGANTLHNFVHLRDSYIGGAAILSLCTGP